LRICRLVRTVVAWGVFSPFVKAQIARFLQLAFKGLADRPREGLQFLPVDLAVSPVMPLMEQLVLQFQQIPHHRCADAGAFRDGSEIPLDVVLAELRLLQWQPAVGALAIGDHNAAVVVAQQLAGHLRRAAEHLLKHG